MAVCVCVCVCVFKKLHLIRSYFVCAGEHRIVIFLPPSSHLLLKFQVYEKSTTVFISSDNWKLLPLVNSYLLSLAAKKPGLASES